MSERKKILVVDDEPDILRIVIFRLKQAGYEVHTAGDGKAGLEAAQRLTPDLILLDLRMPVMDGYETCRALKSDKMLEKIPVIFLSASSLEDLESKIKEFGLQDYILKPFDPQELIEKVKSYIG